MVISKVLYIGGIGGIEGQTAIMMTSLIIIGCMTAKALIYYLFQITIYTHLHLLRGRIMVPIETIAYSDHEAFEVTNSLLIAGDNIADIADYLESSHLLLYLMMIQG